MKVLILLLLLIPSISHANEVNDLSAIIYSESRGESVEGVILIGHAAKNRSRKTNKPMCKIEGVTRKTPPKALADYYRALSQSIISSDNDPSNDADSWNTGRTPAFKGKIKRNIGRHVLYAMDELR